MILNQQRNLSFKTGLMELVEDHWWSDHQNIWKFSNWMSIMSSLWDIFIFLYNTKSKSKCNIAKSEKISLKFFFKKFEFMDCSKSVFWLSTIVFHRCGPRWFMHSWLNLLFQKGSRRVQLLFSWYLFFGFKVNKFSKALGQALFLHLNMRHKILKIFISYIFNTPISLKRGLECVNWTNKEKNKENK